MSIAGQIRWMRTGASAALLLLAIVPCVAQTAGGELTLTPLPSISTIAGNGTRGWSGDGAAAKSAALASPRGAAYDTAGNLYIADTGNHVIRKVTPDGTITTFAGTGVQGFAGDGGPATKAEFNLPYGTAVAGDGTVYVADTGNRRVRIIHTDGTVETFAGTGSSGEADDGGVAAGASFRKPVAVAVNSSGLVYIADAGAFRVRVVDVGGKIRAFAGNGRQGTSGLNGTAISAELDDPAALAIDGNGRLLIVDRRNRRVLAVAADGIIREITTVSAGHVDGVSGMPDGSIVVANGGLHTVVRTDGTAVGREAGNGEQTLSADGVAALGTGFDRPVALAASPAGSVAVVERGGRVSSLDLPALQWGSTAVGATSNQTLTLKNTGSAAISVSAMSFPAQFQVGGGSCGSLPIQLAVSQACSVQIAFSPTSAGPVRGTATFGGSGFVSRSVVFSGEGAGGPLLVGTSTTLEVPATSATGASLSITAHVFASGAGVPGGTVDFFDDVTRLGTANLVQGISNWTVTSPSNGLHSFSANYSGDVHFAASSSAKTVSVVGAPPADFILNAGPSSSTNLVAAVRAPALFQFQIGPQSGTSPQTVTFSVIGIPSNVTIGFDPASVVPNATPQTVLMTVKVTEKAGLQSRSIVFFALLLPMFYWRKCKRWKMVFVASLLVSGCASGNRSSSTTSNPVAQPLTLVAKATSGTGQVTTHTLQLTLTVR